MIKIFGLVIMSSDDYGILMDTKESTELALNEAMETNAKLSKANKKYEKDFNALLAKYDEAEEELFDLQKKAYVRGEKGRFMKYLKSIAIENENNTNQ
jgi:DNA repair ATPase RecN